MADSTDDLELRQGVFNEVANERHYQDHKWGGPDHDDNHTLTDWAELIRQRTDPIIVGAGRIPENKEYDPRRLFIEIAALSVAAVESLDRKEPPSGSDR